MTDKGDLKEFTITGEELKPWALQAFLDLITEEANKHGLSTLDATVRVDVILEGFSSEADLPGLRGALEKRWCFVAGQEAKR